MNRAERRRLGIKGAHRNARATVVFGAGCTWWDTIDKAGKNAVGMPVCPHCSSVLYELPTMKDWYDRVDAHDKQEPGYREFINWLRGQCFPGMDQANAAYSLERELTEAEDLIDDARANQIGQREHSGDKPSGETKTEN